MDVIKKFAEEFKYSFHEYGYNLETYDNELTNKLFTIKKDLEKLRFLSYLRDYAETEYKEHAPNCPNPITCQTNLNLENSLYSIKQQYDEISKYANGLELGEKPAMKFFEDGQYFDAYTAIRDLVKEAKKSIVLVDGYVDENTLKFFPSKEPQIKLRILTSQKSMRENFTRCVELYEKQYGNIEVSQTASFHDRFLIIDYKNFYHIGASIKDAGNKTFMYTKIEDSSIIETLENKLTHEWKNIFK